jgi:hypothetical protein
MMLLVLATLVLLAWAAVRLGPDHAQQYRC